MIRIEKKYKCCGCEACVQICPKHCISFDIDAEGFRYPSIDESLCIDCGICENICPILTPFESKSPASQLAAINPNDYIRLQSSSGGIFTMLAEYTIKQGGVVFGARYDKNWNVVFDYATTNEGIVPFRGSKYMQARVGASFIHVRNFLKEGRLVMFTGTPCQVSALKHFLRKDYDNLICVDFVCHGVPSPKVWQKYFNEVVQNAILATRDVRFRSKKRGWRRFNLDLVFDNGRNQYCVSSCFKDNHFMRIFLKDIILRPSCYHCKAKCGRSGSDVTIGDFWGLDKINPQLDDDLGTSILLVYSKNGERIIDNLNIKKWLVSYNDVVRFNSAIEHNAVEHPMRGYFFSKFDSSLSFVDLVEDTLYVPLVKQLKQRMRKIVKNLYHRVMIIVKGDKSKDINNTTTSKLPINNFKELLVSSVNFRSKHSGWKQYKMEIILASKNKEMVSSKQYD